MTPSPLIRLARHIDLDAIWQIESSVFGDPIYPAFFFRQALDLWPELLLVIEQDERLLGYVLGGLGQDRELGWVLSLAVQPEARGQGLAQRLLEELEWQLRKQGMQRARLTVDPSNPANRLYQRLGYQLVAVEAEYFGPGEPRNVLEKALHFTLEQGQPAIRA